LSGAGGILLTQFFQEPQEPPKESRGSVQTPEVNILEPESEPQEPEPLDWSYFFQRYFEWLRTGAVSLPFLIFGIWYGWKRYRRRLLLIRRTVAGTPQIDFIVVQGPAQQLFRGTVFRRTAQEFRKHREIGAYELNALVLGRTLIDA
jgi:hypothetical protein